MSEPFDGDVVALDTVARIVREEGCLDFVETGTCLGDTTLGMYRMFPQLTIWTVEGHWPLYVATAAKFKGTEIRHFCGDSPAVLREQILSNLRPRPFFYLDAHWSAENVLKHGAPKEQYPLRDEILAIATVSHLRPIIAIHDFVSPTRPDFSFDVDHGKPLNWDYIKDVVRSVYPGQEPIPHFHNTNATHRESCDHCTGIVYIGVSE